MSSQVLSATNYHSNHTTLSSYLAHNSGIWEHDHLDSNYSTKLSPAQIYPVYCELTRQQAITLAPVSQSYELLRGQWGNYHIILYTSGTLQLLRRSGTSPTQQDQLDILASLSTLIDSAEEDQFRLVLTRNQYQQFVRTDTFASCQKISRDKSITKYRFQSVIIEIDRDDYYLTLSYFNRQLVNTLLDIIDSSVSTTAADLIIGQDEVGTTEIFQRMFTTAVAVPRSLLRYLRLLGLRDTKRYHRSFNFAPLVKSIQSIAEVTDTIAPKHSTIERLQVEFDDEGKRFDSLLAWSHARVLSNLLETLQDSSEISSQSTQVIIDKFNRELTLERIHTMLPNSHHSLSIVQQSRAEDEFVTVAAAACIAKYLQRNKMRQINTDIGYKFDPRRHFHEMMLRPELFDKVNRARLQREIKAGRILAKTSYDHRESKRYFDYITGFYSQYLTYLDNLDSDFTKSTFKEQVIEYTTGNGGDIFIGINKTGYSKYKATNIQAFRVKQQVESHIRNLETQTGQDISYIIREFQLGNKKVINVHICPRVR